MRFIDRFLNSITMYALLFYGLLALAGISIGLSLVGINDLPAADQALSLLVLPVTILSSIGFAKFFGATRNLESAGITGLIIFFLFDPAASVDEFAIIALAGVLASATKFLIAPSKRHLLNPAAAAAVIIGFLQLDQAIWWIARNEMTIPMIIFGFLVLRKLHRFSMFFAFFGAALLVSYFTVYDADIAPLQLLENLTTVWPTLFLGTIMLTEPLTTPPRRLQQLVYGALVGVLLTSGLSVGTVFMTPELAIIVANVVFYFAFLQRRVKLTLIERKEVAKDVYGFEFEPSRKLNFTPGQYLEVTAPLPKQDKRGNRRSFSIASAPDEKHLKLGIRLPESPSKYKSFMMDMKPGDSLFTNHLLGDFVLPRDGQNFVFIAGGIGITPFRSMIADLVLREDNSRDIVMFYQASSTDQFAYRKLFDNPKTEKYGVRTIYVASAEDAPTDWSGETGFIDNEMLAKHAPDYKERTFYLSGPNAMVESYTRMLKKAGVSSRHIKHDYFSGY